jgi:hypothetical protein
MLNAVMLKIIILSVNIHVRHYSECEYADVIILSVNILNVWCHFTEWHYVKRHYSECQYAEHLYA